MVGRTTFPSTGASRRRTSHSPRSACAVGVYLQFALTRMSSAIRQEQVQGTLEAMLSTPTAPGTVQLGLVVFDLLYVPVRTFVFLGVMTLVFDLGLDPAGILPALACLVALTPFVWGLGVLGAATILVVRRGTGIAALVGGLVALASGAYVPVDVLPQWVEELAAWNPIAVALDGMRSSPRRPRLELDRRRPSPHRPLLGARAPGRPSGISDGASTRARPRHVGDLLMTATAARGVERTASEFSDAPWEGVARVLGRASSLEASAPTDSTCSRRRGCKSSDGRSRTSWRPLQRARCARAPLARALLSLIREVCEGPILVFKGPEIAAVYPSPWLRPYARRRCARADDACRRAPAARRRLPGGRADDELGCAPSRPAPRRPRVSSPRWRCTADRSGSRTSGHPPSTICSRPRPRPRQESTACWRPRPDTTRCSWRRMHGWSGRSARVGDLVDVAAARDAAPEEADELARRYGVERIWRTTLGAIEAVLGDNRRTWPMSTWARHRARQRAHGRRDALARLLEPFYRCAPTGSRRGGAGVRADAAARSRRGLAREARPHAEGVGFRADPPSRSMWRGSTRKRGRGSVNQLRLRRDGLHWVEADGEIVALDDRSLQYLSANAVGAVLWQSLIEGATRDELLARILEEFDVEEDVAARDLDGFLASWRRLGCSRTECAHHLVDRRWTSSAASPGRCEP